MNNNTIQESAAWFAERADEVRNNSTVQENLRRAENGRRPNVATVFPEEDAAMFLVGAESNDETRAPFAYA